MVARCYIYRHRFARHQTQSPGYSRPNRQEQRNRAEKRSVPLYSSSLGMNFVAPFSSSSLFPSSVHTLPYSTLYSPVHSLHPPVYSLHFLTHTRYPLLTHTRYPLPLPVYGSTFNVCLGVRTQHSSTVCVFFVIVIPSLSFDL